MVKEKKNILVCFDMNGTLINDGREHLGHTNHWKRKVEILHGVVSGIKLLNKNLPDSKVFIVTNQTGIAIKNFKLLTPRRCSLICEYVIDELALRGAVIDGFEFAGRARKEYVKRRSQYAFLREFVGSSSLIKPKWGMIRKILKKLGWERSETLIYVVGDRYVDVRTGLNVGGYGILVPLKNEAKNIRKVERYVKGEEKKRSYVASGFKDGCEWIVGNVKR